MQQFVEQIYRGVSLGESLPRLLEQVRQTLCCDRVVLWRFIDRPAVSNPRVACIELVAETTAPGWLQAMTALTTGYVQRSSDPFLDALVQCSMPAIAAQVDRRSPFPPHLTALGVRSRVLMPLVVHTNDALEPWGVLSAHHCQDEREWTVGQCAILEQTAAMIALAIQHAALQDQLQRQAIACQLQVCEQAIQFQQAIDHDETLKRITDKVRDSLDEEQIVQNAVREVAIALQVGSCNAAIYDLERKTSQILYEETNFLPEQIYRESNMSAFPELYDQLLSKQYFQFCSMQERAVDRHGDRQGRVAMLACPMHDNDGVIGDLWVVHESSHEFSDLEIRLVRQVANQCAIAIRQARLYQSSQAQVAALEKLNQLKDDFLSTISHELKTPISNMNMAIQMLEIQLGHLELSDETQTRMERYLAILKAECKREDELVTDLLDLQRLEEGGYSSMMSVIDIDKWLQKIEAFTRSRLLSRQQTLTIKQDVQSPLITDRAILDRIVVELLHNAVKYSADGSEIGLCVREASQFETDTAPDTPRKLHISVTNPATIAPDELPKIFSKFYRIPNADPWKQGGTGLGLALIDRLVRQLDGTLDVASKDGLTTFMILIPNRRDKFVGSSAHD